MPSLQLENPLEPTKHPRIATGRPTLRVSDTISLTTEYLVASLPEVEFDFGEMYAGLVPINPANDSEALFFIFKPSDTPVDEITIWLNGGPGCSSMKGFFEENGPISWQPGTIMPVRNEYAWNTMTNMLWVDQPIGTGFATGTPRATSQDDTAEDFVAFFKGFEDIFGIRDYKVFLTGESYAGRYLSYIASHMLDAEDPEHFDVAGALLYDPTIGEFESIQSQIPAYPAIEANINLWGFNQSYMDTLRKVHEECGYGEYLDTFLTYPPSGPQPPMFFDYNDKRCNMLDTAIQAAYSINPCFSPYELRQTCPIPIDVLGMPGGFEHVPPGWFVYFDRLDVKAALHAPPITWTACSPTPVYLARHSLGGPQAQGDLSPDPIQHVLPKLIEATNRVLVANGDFDFMVLTNGTLLAIQNMTWGGEMGFQEQPHAPFIVDTPDVQWDQVFFSNGLWGYNGAQGTMGVQHFERGLMWVQTFMSGHMVPQSQPRAALKHLAWVLGRIDEL